MNKLDYLRLAYKTAVDYSTDPSTQNGAVIVVGDRFVTGANHFPKGVVENVDRWKRPLKYFYVEHAERDVIFKAAKLGVPTDGAIMYCPWAACADCARAIIQSGIVKVVVHHDPLNTTRFGLPVSQQWVDSIKISNQMFLEAGIEIDILTDNLFENEDFKIRFNEQLVRVN